MPRLLAAIAITTAVLAVSAPPADAGGKKSKAAASPAARDLVAQLLIHARDLLDAGQADSVIAVLAPALAAAPPGAPLDPRLTRALVLACGAAGTPWEGVHAIADMIRVRPGEVQLYAALGELELQRRRPEVALRQFQLAIMTDNRSPEALGGFGRCRARVGGSVENALSYLDKLAKGMPGNAAVRYGKGVLLLEAGRVDEAVAEFKWALGLDDAMWQNEREYGRALLRLGDRQGATAHLVRAVQLLDAAGDPLTADRVGQELRAAAEGAGG